MPEVSPFPEPATERTSPLRYTEPLVRWLIESTNPEAVMARRNINDWYHQFPDRTGRLLNRLRSDANTDHLQALDELYTHHLLETRFSDVRYEVGEAGPDFRLCRDGEYVGGVEVLSLFQSKERAQEEQRNARIVDAINANMRPTSGYFLALQHVQGNGQRYLRDLVSFISARIAELPPPEQLTPELRASSKDALQATYTSPDNSLSIDMGFVPIPPCASRPTDPDTRIVWADPIVVESVTTAKRLRKRIGEKIGGRYDINGLPFLVVVGVHDFHGDEPAMQALYGTDMISPPTRALSRVNNGLFGVRDSTNGKNRRLSAVALLNQFKSWDPQGTDVAVLHNPFAARP